MRVKTSSSVCIVVGGYTNKHQQSPNCLGLAHISNHDLFIRPDINSLPKGGAQEQSGEAACCEITICVRSTHSQPSGQHQTDVPNPRSS